MDDDRFVLMLFSRIYRFLLWLFFGCWLMLINPEGSYSLHSIVSLAQANEYKSYLPVIFTPYKPSNPFGIEVHSAAEGSGLDQMLAGGASWLRPTGILWSDVEPMPGSRDWSKLADLEDMILKAQAEGVKIILVVRSAPAWAQLQAGHSCGPIKEEAWQPLGDFLYDLVMRYHQPPFQVKYWEIWNEPDVDYRQVYPNSPFGCLGNWDDSTYFGGDNYGRMLRILTPRIKQADPDAKVIVGGLLLDCDPRTPPLGADCRSSNFFEGILKETNGDYFDGVGIHAYDYYRGELGRYSNLNWHSLWNTSGPSLLTKRDFIQEKLDNYHVNGKFIISTENGLLCDLCADDEAFEQTKAYYIVQSYAGSLARGMWGNIWYDVFGWRNSGLLNPDLSPKPAYRAYQFMSFAIKDMVFYRAIEEYANVRGYIFHNGAQPVWIMWSLDGENHQVVLPSLPQQVTNLYGDNVETATEIWVGLEPRFVFY
jgi:hypothetical protein